MKEELDDYPRDRSIAGPLFDAGPFQNSPVPPSKPEILVAGIIWPHKGRANPIPIARLTEHTELSARQIKGIVEELRVSHLIPIGASREEPAGYFVIVDADDLKAAVAPYRSQILTMWRNLRAMDSPRNMSELRNQLTVEETDAT